MLKLIKTLEKLEKQDYNYVVLARAENRESSKIEEIVIKEMNAHLCVFKFVITKDDHLVAILPATTKWTDARDTYKYILAGMKLGIELLESEIKE